MLLCRDVELGMEPGRPAPSQVDLPMSTGRHQRRRISRRSDDNDSWMRTGSGRRGGGRRARLDEDWKAGELEDEDERGVAAGAPCTTSNTGSTPPRRLGDSTMLRAPPPFSTPGHRTVI